MQCLLLERKAFVANLLSCGVVQLILAGSLETVLNTGILPQGLNGISNFWWEVVALDLLWLHKNGLNVILGPLVVKWELQRLHGLEDNAHRLDCVGENDLFEGLSFIARVATLVDKLHLLENGRLSRLSSTYTIISRPLSISESR